MFLLEFFDDEETMNFERFKNIMHSSNSVMTVVVMATIFNNLPCSNYCLKKKADFWTHKLKGADESDIEIKTMAPISKIAFPKLGSLQENIP